MTDDERRRVDEQRGNDEQRRREQAEPTADKATTEQASGATEQSNIENIGELTPEKTPEDEGITERMPENMPPETGAPAAKGPPPSATWRTSSAGSVWPASNRASPQGT